MPESGWVNSLTNTNDPKSAVAVPQHRGSRFRVSSSIHSSNLRPETPSHDATISQWVGECLFRWRQRYWAILQRHKRWSTASRAKLETECTIADGSTKGTYWGWRGKFGRSDHRLKMDTHIGLQISGGISGEMAAPSNKDRSPLVQGVPGVHNSGVSERYPRRGCSSRDLCSISLIGLQDFRIRLGLGLLL
jgi:hypothetical protein